MMAQSQFVEEELEKNPNLIVQSFMHFA